jgi:hypothetical protein
MFGVASLRHQHAPVAALPSLPPQWNEALLEAAIAPAYTALLLEAAQLLGPTKAFWQLLPAGQDGSIPQPWLKAAAALYAGLAQQPVLWSPVGQGAWLTPRQALLPDAACFASASGRAGAASVDSAVASEQQQLAAAATEASPSDVWDSDTAAGAGVLGHVGGNAKTSYLAQLLVACGVPLVLALSEEQQRCLLQWTPGTQQVGALRSMQTGLLSCVVHC